MRRLLRSLGLGFALTALTTQSAPGQQADSLASRAYAHLAAQQVDSAILAFEAALRARPDLVSVRADLAYALLRANQPERALAEFVEVTRRDPANGTAWLQRGYLHARLRDRRAARDAYEQARRTGTPEVAEQAGRELDALGAGYAPAGVWFFEFYAAPHYQERFDNLISSAQARLGRILDDAPHTEAYLSVRATRDTRSTGGAVPQIFSDNAVVPALGFRLNPTSRAALLLEAGVAVPLVDTDANDVEFDLRGGLFYSDSWAPAGVGRVGELYADAIYYSRFDRNVIANVQYRDGLRLARGAQVAFDLYARGSLIADTNREFGNNLVEGGAGVRLALLSSTGNWLGAEFVRGRYLRDGFRDRDYDDFRVILVLSRFSIFGQAAR